MPKRVSFDSSAKTEREYTICQRHNRSREAYSISHDDKPWDLADLWYMDKDRSPSAKRHVAILGVSGNNPDESASNARIAAEKVLEPHTILNPICCCGKKIEAASATVCSMCYHWAYCSPGCEASDAHVHAAMCRRLFNHYTHTQYTHRQTLKKRRADFVRNQKPVSG
jgi:hypothetical protein